MIHDGWSPYDNFEKAHHQQCLGHLLRRCRQLLQTATRGAVCFPRRVTALLHKALEVRDRYLTGQLNNQGLAVCRGRLHNQLLDAIILTKTNPANERLAKHLWNHQGDLLTFLKFPGLDATNWRAELAIRFGVILRKVWGGNRTWVGARAQAILMSVWRTAGSAVSTLGLPQPTLTSHGSAGPIASLKLRPLEVPNLSIPPPARDTMR